MNPDDLPMKVDQLFIFPAPRIGTAVIRIGKATDARFIAIINRRRARPCHLHDNSLQKHCFFYIMICRLCAETVRSADTTVCSSQKSGMVMVGELIHGSQPGRHRHIRSVICHCAHKAVRVSQKILPIIIAVLLHAC